MLNAGLIHLENIFAEKNSFSKWTVKKILKERQEKKNKLNIVSEISVTGEICNINYESEDKQYLLQLKS